MKLAEKYMREICDRCKNYAKNFSCEDLQTCPAYKLYRLAERKEKAVVNRDDWNIPPTPRPEMI